MKQPITLAGETELGKITDARKQRATDAFNTIFEWKEEDFETLKNELMEKKDEKTILPLIPPTDPRLLMQIAPFEDDMLKDFKVKDRKELVKKKQ